MSSVHYDAVLGSGLTIPNCEAMSFDGGLVVTPGRNSGAVDAHAHFITGGNPRIMGTTTALAVLLGSGGILPGAGLSIASADNIDFWLSRRAPGGTRAGSSSHTRIRGATGGMASLSQIQASQDGGHATASFELGLLSSDGLVVPCGIAVDQSLPSQTPGAYFAMGPVYGTKSGGSSTIFKDVIGHTVSPGQDLLFEKADGAVYPKRAYIKERNPTADITILDEEDLDFWCDLFNQCTALTFYYRKRTIGSTFVADNVSEHIALSFADCVATISGVGGSGTETAPATIRITGEALSVSVASTIPSS